METLFDKARRKFLALTLATLPIGMAAAAYGWRPLFSEREVADLLELRKGKKLGFALVGLGGYAISQLGPALKLTQLAELKAVVTGDSEKGKRWAKDYNFPEQNVLSYPEIARLAQMPEVDVVYIVLPNFLHAEYTIKALQAGKHVICEKPMAMNVQEAEEMIAAAKKANKKLGVGYRLHLDPYHQQVMEWGKKQTFGKIKEVEAGFGFIVQNPNQWRMRKAESGGGPLVDVGIYCIQGMRYATGLEPIAVTARNEFTDRKGFSDVEITTIWKMEFPNGIVGKGRTSYQEGYNFLKINAEKGEYGIDPAYMYSGQKIFQPKDAPKITPRNQQAAHMDDFCLSVLNNKALRTPGEMGLQDQKIMAAIYKAAASGERTLV